MSTVDERLKDRVGLEEGKKNPWSQLDLAGAQVRTALAGVIPEESMGAAGPLLEDGMITGVLVRPVPERWVPTLTGWEGPS